MKKIFFSIIVFLTLVLAPATVYAAVGLPDYLRPQGLPSATRGTQLDESSADYAAKGVQLIIADVISIALVLAGALAVFEIINNAWYMIAAFGKGETIDQHKKGLFWAITGLILVIISYIVVQFLVEFIIAVSEESAALEAPAPQSMLMRWLG